MKDTLQCPFFEAWTLACALPRRCGPLLSIYFFLLFTLVYLPAPLPCIYSNRMVGARCNDGESDQGTAVVS